MTAADLSRRNSRGPKIAGNRARIHAYGDRGSLLPEPQLPDRLDFQDPVGDRTQLIERAERFDPLPQLRRNRPEPLSQEAEHRLPKAIDPLLEPRFEAALEALFDPAGDALLDPPGFDLIGPCQFHLFDLLRIARTLGVELRGLPTRQL